MFLISWIKNNFHKHEVVVVDQNNYQNYVEIPQYIIDKLNQGIITITHFSDIMRASLLAKWGGVWMDATMYLVDSIEDEIQGYEFYSNKLPADNQFATHVDKANWSAFFLACGAENPILVNLRNILFEYWKTHTMLINYFLVDYCIKLSYDKFESLHKIIEKVPVNNVHLHDLQPLLNEPFDQATFEKLTQDTKFFKLTYKMDFSKGAEHSYYNYLLKQ